MPRSHTAAPCATALLLATFGLARSAAAQHPGTAAPATTSAGAPATTTATTTTTTPPGTEDAAEALVREGVALREQRRDADALARFEQAYAQGHGARALAQMGLAEQALGRWVVAEAHLRAALASDDGWIARSRAPLEEAVAAVQRHLGSLEVVSEVAGAELWVNGVRVATLPLAAPVRVPTGSVAIELRAPGYRVATRTTNVDAGASVREELALVPQPSTSDAAAAPGAAVAHPGPARGSRDGGSLAATAAAPHRAGATQRAVGWGLLGGAGVFLLGGVAASIAREALLPAWNDDAMCLPADGRTRGEACADLGRGLDAAEALRVVGYVGAGALAVTSVILLVTAPRDPAPAERPHARAQGSTAPRVRWVCAPESGPLVPLGARCTAAF